MIREEFELSNSASEWMEERWRQEIEQLNSRFAPYIGNDRLGAKTRELCDKIRMSNWAINESWAVYIRFGDITGLDTREKWKNSDATCDDDEILSLMRTKINGMLKYDISASYDENGRIMGVGIIERPSSSENTQSISNTNNI